jgi:hypothetical protein
MAPLEEQYMKGKITEQGKTETAYKPGQIVDWGDYNKGGKVHKVKKQFLGLNPDKSERWKVVEDVTPEVAPKEPKDLDAFDFQQIAAGTKKDPRVSQEQAAHVLDQMSKSPYARRQAAIQMAVKSDDWYQANGNPQLENQIIDKYENMLGTSQNSGIVDVTSERQKAAAAITAARGNPTAIANIKAAYQSKTGQPYK